MWTKISAVPSPSVRNPKPRSRLNHFTIARSSPLVGITVTCVRGAGICAGWIAVDSSHGEDSEGLPTLRPLHRLDHDSRALMSGLESIATQAGHVQKHVGHAVVGDDEPEPLGDIEPFDHARNLDDRCRRIADQIVERPDSNTKVVPGPLGLITFVVMRTHAAAIFGASFGRFA